MLFQTAVGRDDWHARDSTLALYQRLEALAQWWRMADGGRGSTHVCLPACQCSCGGKALGKYNTATLNWNSPLPSSSTSFHFLFFNKQFSRLATRSS